MAAAYVNTGHGFNTASGGSIATGATSHTTGNLLVCCVRHEGATTTISVADTAGNTWTPLTKVTHPGGDMHLQLFYVLNCTGNASNVVTATFGASRTFRGIQVQQFSGLNSYDEENSGTTTAGTSVTSGTVNIDGAGVVVNGIAIYGGLVTWSASTGYTLVQNTSDTQRMGMSYELETGSSAESPGASGSSNDDWIIVSAAFLEASAASVDQEGFRFRNDDGSETTATWAASQDTNVTKPLSANLRLRMLMNATGDPAATAYTLYHQKNGAGGYTKVPLVASSSPTLSYGEAGTLAYSTSGGTSVAPSYPANITVNSGLVLVIGQKPSSANGGTCTTPSGWTLQYELSGANDGDTGGYTTTLGADTGNCNIYVYTKDTVSGSESGTLSVTVGTNNVCWAQIIRLQASDTATWSWAASGGKDTSAGNVSIATSAGIDVTAGDYLIGGMVIPTDVTTPAQFSSEAFSQTGTTFGTMAEISEPDSGTGNDIGGFLFYNNASSGSGSGAVTMTATAGGTTTNVRGPGFVIRARVASVTFPVYVSASSNITAGGEATTAQLTAPSGKTTSDFVTGRMWDNENGTDTIDITTDDYTEVEWCLIAQSPAVNGDYFDFRVYKGSTAADTYTVTPKWTIGTAGGTTRGTPFGARGTAFNGGRTQWGIIR